MQIHHFTDMLEIARQVGPMPIVVVAADDPEVLTSLVDAAREGIITATLIGDRSRIEKIAGALHLDVTRLPIIHAPAHTEAAWEAIRMVRDGRAKIVVKGLLKTTDLLGPVLDKNEGLRDKGLLTHMAAFEIPGRAKLLYISDSGVVLYPTWEQKLEIIRNAIDFVRRFGVSQPKVAVLGASDRISLKTGLGVEALALSTMAMQGAVSQATVEGPLPVDVAVTPYAARIKGLQTRMPGDADILIVPHVDAGNVMCKALQYFGGLRMAGFIIGARAPIIINSRADDAETRLLSMAMAVVWTAADTPQ